MGDYNREQGQGIAALMGGNDKSVEILEIRNFTLKVAIPLYVSYILFPGLGIAFIFLGYVAECEYNRYRSGYYEYNGQRHNIHDSCYYVYGAHSELNNSVYSDIVACEARCGAYRVTSYVMFALTPLPLLLTLCIKHGDRLTLTAYYLPLFLRAAYPIVVVLFFPVVFSLLMSFDIAFGPIIFFAYLLRSYNKLAELGDGIVDIRTKQGVALGNVTLSKPMLVMDKSTLLALTPSSTFEDTTKNLFSPMAGDKIVFLSHKWNSPTSWDADGKLLALMQADASKDPDDCCYWIDYFCIPAVENWEVKVVWIRNIPNFLNVCTDVRYYSLSVNPMLSSAWCLYEILSDKSFGKEKLGRVQVTIRTPSGTEKVIPRLKMVQAQTARELHEVLMLCKVRLAARGYLESEITNWMKSCEEMQGNDKV